MRRLLVLLVLALFSLGHGCEEHGEDDYYDDKNLTAEAVTEGGLTVAYTTSPSPIPIAEEFSMTIEVGDDAGPVQLQGLELRGDMPAHGHGMNVEPVVTDLGDGVWSLDPLLLHMPGHWELEVAVQVDGVWDSALFDVRCCDE